LILTQKYIRVFMYLLQKIKQIMKKKKKKNLKRSKIERIKSIPVYETTNDGIYLYIYI